MQYRTIVDAQPKKICAKKQLDSHWLQSNRCLCLS